MYEERESEESAAMKVIVTLMTVTLLTLLIKHSCIKLVFILRMFCKAAMSTVLSLVTHCYVGIQDTRYYIVYCE